jgi:hypothetical protein
MGKLVPAFVALPALIVGSVNYMGCGQGETFKAYRKEGFSKFQEQDYDGPIHRYELVSG